jgi:hypothetical protein
MHAETSKGLALSWMHSIQLGWSLFQFSYRLVYWCEWVVVAFSIKLHKQAPFLTQNKHSKTLSAESYFLNFWFTLILQNSHLRLDLGSEWCPYALSPVIMVKIILSFRLLCVFPSITLQPITHHSWRIQVPGWLLITISYPLLLPHTISVLWWSDFF